MKTTKRTNLEEALLEALATEKAKRRQAETRVAELAEDLRAAKERLLAETELSGRLSRAGGMEVAARVRAEKIATEQATIIRAQAALIETLSIQVPLPEFAVAR